MISVYRFAHGKLFLVIRKPLCKLIGLQLSYVTGFFQGPTWRKSKAGAVLLANRRYDGSRSRKTKGSLADTSSYPRPHFAINPVQKVRRHTGRLLVRARGASVPHQGEDGHEGRRR